MRFKLIQTKFLLSVLKIKNVRSREKQSPVQRSVTTLLNWNRNQLAWLLSGQMQGEQGSPWEELAGAPRAQPRLWEWAWPLYGTLIHDPRDLFKKASLNEQQLKSPMRVGYLLGRALCCTTSLLYPLSLPV